MGVQTAYRKAVAARASCDIANVLLKNIANALAARRLLSERLRRQLDAASGVTFDVEVTAPSAAKVSEVQSSLAAWEPTAITAALTTELQAASLTVPAVLGVEALAVAATPASDDSGGASLDAMTIGIAAGCVVGVAMLALAARKRNNSQPKAPVQPGGQHLVDDRFGVDVGMSTQDLTSSGTPKSVM